MGQLDLLQSTCPRLEHDWSRRSCTSAPVPSPIGDGDCDWSSPLVHRLENADWCKNRSWHAAREHWIRPKNDGGRNRTKTLNALKVAKSRARANAGQVSLPRVVADAKNIERLLLSEGLLSPDRCVDYDMATPVERREARET
jgi:hypothetical protein